MQGLLKFTAVIDGVLGLIARIGAMFGLGLAVVVVYDVITRHFGVPKPFGMNSTQFQESEYWMHTVLFTMCLGYAYTRQSHVRIDLIRDRLPLKAKYFLEILGCIFFLFPFSIMAIIYNYRYAYASFLEGEVSKSVIGLSHIWVLKSALPIMFVLLLAAGISQLIKAIAGLTGNLPDEMVSETLGGDH